MERPILYASSVGMQAWDRLSLLQHCIVIILIFRTCNNGQNDWLPLLLSIMVSWTLLYCLISVNRICCFAENLSYSWIGLRSCWEIISLFVWLQRLFKFLAKQLSCNWTHRQCNVSIILTKKRFKSTLFQLHWFSPSKRTPFYKTTCEDSKTANNSLKPEA